MRSLLLSHTVRCAFTRITYMAKFPTLALGNSLINHKVCKVPKLLKWFGTISIVDESYKFFEKEVCVL